VSPKVLDPNLELLHIYFTYFTYLHAKVFSVQFSHDSTLLLTASMDGSARTCRFNVAEKRCRVGDFGGRLRNGRLRRDCHRLPGFPTFRRVKTRSSSQAKMNPDFAASSCGNCGNCGTVGGHTDWLRCAAFSPDSLKATAQMWMNWMNMEQKGQVES
jgi:WD40 repeat protein